VVGINVGNVEGIIVGRVEGASVGTGEEEEVMIRRAAHSLCQ